MSIIYFITEDGSSIVALDCEESIEISKQNQVSNYSVMGGDTVSDGYSEGNKIVNLSGKVTYTKSSTQQTQGTPNPIELQDMLDSFSRNHYRFRMYTDDSALPLLRGIENCMLGSSQVSLGGWRDTIQVDMTINEIFVSQAARVTELPPIPTQETSKTTKDPEKGSGGKTTASEEKKGTILFNFVNKGNLSGN